MARRRLAGASLVAEALIGVVVDRQAPAGAALLTAAQGADDPQAAAQSPHRGAQIDQVEN